MLLIKITEEDAEGLAELLDEMEEFPRVCDALLNAVVADDENLPPEPGVIKLTPEDISRMDMEDYDFYRKRLMQSTIKEMEKAYNSRHSHSVFFDGLT